MLFNVPFCSCLAENKQGAGRRGQVVLRTEPQPQTSQGEGRRGAVEKLIDRSLECELLRAAFRLWMGATRSPKHLLTSDRREVDTCNRLIYAGISDTGQNFSLAHREKKYKTIFVAAYIKFLFFNALPDQS